ncbi:hypothetical protein Naga_100105g1 [Nannochloropsis gaditana]|uniref:Uncharacterized protein n=1 Tax=Nannochloropsis gaditana TaxID=72520 RepID=W7TLG5_9STRA|nr:hypothetical protein Naga_100105g1 [Nannochloropsis gaditana]
MTRVGFRSPASPRPGQRAARGLFGLRRRRIPNGFAEGKPTAAVGTGYGLALGWNDPRRLLRLENLLDAVALPALPPSLSEEQDPVRSKPGQDEVGVGTVLEIRFSSKRVRDMLTQSTLCTTLAHTHACR